MAIGTDLWGGGAYVTSFLVAWRVLSHRFKWLLGLDRWYTVHVALMSVFAVQGAASVLFAYTSVPLSYRTLALATALISLAVCLLKPSQQACINETAVDGATGHWGVLLGYLLGASVGLQFFTLDLLPSSMTGDPARHFLALYNLNDASVASAFKPIYYIWCGAAVYLGGYADPDKLFVMFNCLVLGGAVVSVDLLAVVLAGRVGGISRCLLAVLVAFGYHYFALQYGYFALLLSSSYAFCFLACAMLAHRLESAPAYWVATVMFIGVALTHSYLVPELALAALLMSIVRQPINVVSLRNEFIRVFPCWLAMLAAVVLSNPFFSKSSGVSLGKIVSAIGFGTENLFGNLLPFVLLIIPVPFMKAAKQIKWLYFSIVLSVVLFTLLMWDLSLFGKVHPYYVNRNLIVLLPLLTIGAVWWVDKLSRIIKWSVMLLIGGAVTAPYFLIERMPLTLSDKHYLELLGDNSQFIYLANLQATRYSPLQFTENDRVMLRTLDQSCGVDRAQQFTVLGTDHEVTWVGHYSGVPAPLSGSWDQFIAADFNESNYNAWLIAPGAPYLLMVRHMNYEVPAWVLKGVKLHAEVVCSGDSFDLYQRRPPVSQ